MKSTLERFCFTVKRDRHKPMHGEKTKTEKLPDGRLLREDSQNSQPDTDAAEVYTSNAPKYSNVNCRGDKKTQRTKSRSKRAEFQARACRFCCAPLRSLGIALIEYLSVHLLSPEVDPSFQS